MGGRSLGVGCGDGPERGTGKSFRAMEVFYILIVVVITQLYTIQL